MASVLFGVLSCTSPENRGNGAGGSSGGASGNPGSGGGNGGAGGAQSGAGSSGTAGKGAGGAAGAAGGSGGGGSAGAGAGGATSGGAGGAGKGGSGGAASGGAGGGGSPGTGGGAGGGTGGAGGTTSSLPTAWINDKAVAPSNTLGIQGNWYAFGDGTTTTQSGNPYRDGKYCVKGTAPGDGDSSAHWGAGIGLDLSYDGSKKQPYQYEGRITGFKIKLTGTVPTTPRVQYVYTTDGSVSPFITATMDQSTTYAIADAKVPFEWSVPNAGKGVEGGILYSVQVLVDGAAKAGAIDLCIAEFEPVFDPNGSTGNKGGPYINSDGFIQPSGNTFGIQGPAYIISDGTSTTQTGNPWSNGNYCVSGTFTGAKDKWGAGIAFDLNKAAGGSRAAYKWKGAVGGFRMKLTGSSPGKSRIQFIVTEPPDGNQPFVAALLNTTTVYRIKWAQVPTSWDVSDKGKEVGDSLYTVQLYLEGDKSGPFNVCVEEFTPLPDDQLSSNAQTATTGYTGPRTVSDTILAQEYKYWKTNRYKDCGDGTACVPRDDNTCISEGIGYGMLIAVGNDDQATFDKLWAYYKKHKASSGLMTWQTSACGAETATGTATDGDLDAAMALVQAGCKWTGGSYKNDATTLAAAIKKNAVTTCSGKSVLQPGAGFGGCDKTDPSYFAMGYYKVFATLSGDAGWTTLATDSYALLSTLQGKMSGLVPNWCDGSGNPASGDDGKYGDDASRTPWRVATDYVWNNEAKATTFLNNFSKYVESNGGVSRLFTPNSNYRGGSGLSGLPQSSAKAQEYTDAWLQTAVDDTTYYPGTLRLVYMLLAAHKFPKGCN